MSTIIIDRWYHSDCTIGRLSIDDFQCFTLELPWRDNKKNVSCIPEGRYEYFYRKSDKNGDVLELKNVEGRTYIQMHSGNYTFQIEGCILSGDSVKHLNNDSIPDVTNSVNTLRNILRRAGDSGYIEIFSRCGV